MYDTLQACDDRIRYLNKVLLRVSEELRLISSKREVLSVGDGQMDKALQKARNRLERAIANDSE